MNVLILVDTWDLPMKYDPRLLVPRCWRGRLGNENSVVRLGEYELVSQAFGLELSIDPTKIVIHLLTVHEAS